MKEKEAQKLYREASKLYHGGSYDEAHAILADLSNAFPENTKLVYRMHQCKSRAIGGKKSARFGEDADEIFGALKRAHATRRRRVLERKARKPGRSRWSLSRQNLHVGKPPPEGGGSKPGRWTKDWVWGFTKYFAIPFVILPILTYVGVAYVVENPPPLPDWIDYSLGVTKLDTNSQMVADISEVMLDAFSAVLAESVTDQLSEELVMGLAAAVSQALPELAARGGGAGEEGLALSAGPDAGIHRALDRAMAKEDPVADAFYEKLNQQLSNQLSEALSKEMSADLSDDLKIALAVALDPNSDLELSETMTAAVYKDISKTMTDALAPMAPLRTLGSLPEGETGEDSTLQEGASAASYKATSTPGQALGSEGLEAEMTESLTSGLTDSLEEDMQQQLRHELVAILAEELPSTLISAVALDIEEDLILSEEMSLQVRVKLSDALIENLNSSLSEAKMNAPEEWNVRPEHYSRALVAAVGKSLATQLSEELTTELEVAIANALGAKLLEELPPFLGPWSSGEILAQGTLDPARVGWSFHVSAKVQTKPGRISLNWMSFDSAASALKAVVASFGTGTLQFHVYRRLPSDEDWGDPIASVGALARVYVDEKVKAERLYEYRIEADTGSDNSPKVFGYVCSGIRVPFPEDRGLAVLVIEASLVNPLKAELERLKWDLTGEGWRVETEIATPGHIVAEVREMILGASERNKTDLKALLLIGDVPVPGEVGYGSDARGADLSAYTTPSSGRAAEGSMPVLAGMIRASQHGDPKAIQAYLNFDHGFRHGERRVSLRHLIVEGFPDQRFALRSWRYSAVTRERGAVHGDFAKLADPDFVLEYSKEGAGGGLGSANQRSYTARVTRALLPVFWAKAFSSATEPGGRQPFFSVKAYLGAANQWSVFAAYRSGMGLPIGNEVTRPAAYFFLDPDTRDFLLYYAFEPALAGKGTFLGDPTLSFRYIAPVKNVRAVRNGDRVMLMWDRSPESKIEEYSVYRSENPELGFARLGTTGPGETSFVDERARSSRAFYMVRAAKLVESWSGTYFSASTGAFVRVGDSGA